MEVAKIEAATSCVCPRDRLCRACLCSSVGEEKEIRTAGGIQVNSGAPCTAMEVIIPFDWADAAESIVSASFPPPVVFICGPKNSGKSTFSRYLLNALLPRCPPPFILLTLAKKAYFPSLGFVLLSLQALRLNGTVNV